MKLVPAQRIVIYYQKSDFFDKIILRNKKIILNEVLGDDIIIESEVKGRGKTKLRWSRYFLSIRKYKILI